MRRWLFADQLGPHFLESEDQPVLLIESSQVFVRRTFHRAKAHLVLSALRHRAAELGDRCRYAKVARYGEALTALAEPLEVPEPTSYVAEDFVRSLPDVTVVPHPGFARHRDEFRAWAQGRSRLVMEDFYRDQRRRFGVLLEGDAPVGGRWNFDADNREPPPSATTLDVPDPWWPQEDDIDADVRRDLDAWERSGAIRFAGSDGPRQFAVTRAEALQALQWFLANRLPTFGAYEDAMLAADWTMSHSLLSVPLNLGLLHPLEVVRAAEAAYHSGAAPISAVEGFVRQVLGWREYIWGMYWYGGRPYKDRNALAATTPLPAWWWELDADAVTARCLSSVLADLRSHGWAHHIPRLMVLGGYALQRGWDPSELADWFHQMFVDGYAWVMVGNVVGMSQHADGGLLATKPYTSGGAYINRMSDFCGACAYSPGKRLGEAACPYTGGYWTFLARNAERLADNRRMTRPLQGMRRLADLEAVVEQETMRGSSPP